MYFVKPLRHAKCFLVPPPIRQPTPAVDMCWMFPEIRVRYELEAETRDWAVRLQIPADLNGLLVALANHPGFELLGALQCPIPAIGPFRPVVWTTMASQQQDSVAPLNAFHQTRAEAFLVKI
jgi:hypothetical protein